MQKFTGGCLVMITKHNGDYNIGGHINVEVDGEKKSVTVNVDVWPGDLEHSVYSSLEMLLTAAAVAVSRDVQEKRYYDTPEPVKL